MLDRLRTAAKNPKVMAGAGAALIAVVLIARGSRSSSTSDAAPAAASDVASYGAMMPYGGGYAFSDAGLTDSDDMKALHDRFDLLEDTLSATNQQVYDTQAALATSQAVAAEVTTSQTSLAGVIAGMKQMIEDLQSQRQSIGTQPDAAAPSPTAPPPVTPPVSSVSQHTPAPSPSSSGFDRSAIKWQSLYLAKTGGGKQAVLVSKLSDDQIRNALRNGFNGGALAPGWKLLPNGAVVRG